ncbi:9801_t:CDS:10, partial [Acaulospora morrowiae]
GCVDTSIEFVMVTKPILSLNPKGFVSLLRSHGINAFHAIFNPKTGKVVTSHPILQPIGEFFVDEKKDFDKHEAIFGQIGPVSGVLQVMRSLKLRLRYCIRSSSGISTCRGAAAGGVRNWNYETVEDFFRDGIRLSRGMTHKNALANIWWGGGKGIIVRNTGVGLNQESTPQQRKIVFEEYGSFLSSLKGVYVTAEDVGVKEEDVAAIFSKTRFTTCIPPEFGGSGNPSYSTARGVVRALEAVFSYIGKDSLQGSTFAVQGAGHVATGIIHLLLQEKVKHIFVSDVDLQKISAAEVRFAKEFKEGRLTFRFTEHYDHSILFEDVDAVVPSAVGGILNPETIPNIKAKIVCGAANNQLGDLYKDDKLLAERGIIYVPDFLVNRMGIVNCADEAAGYVENDPLFEKHLGDTWEYSIYNLTKFILEKTVTSGSTPQEVAIELAEQKSFETNPIFDHRGIQIINSLIDSEEWKLKIKSSN